MRISALLSLILAGAALAQTQPAATPAAPAREDGLYTTLSTSMGDITLKLYEKESPITVKNFMDLALGRKAFTDPKTGQRVRRPLYNGLTFHRVIPDFMIQGGDPIGNGTGGTDPIKDEFHPTLKFDTPGKLAMANAGAGTGSCQFFITETPQMRLNGLHTIFGQVVEGQAVVKQIANVPRGANDKPITPVIIKKVTFERVGAGAPVNPAPAAAAPKATAPSAAKK